MLLAIIDTETTGIDPNTSDIIEIACIVFDTESMSEIMQISTITPKTLDNPAEFVNRIPNKLLENTQKDFEKTSEKFLMMVAYLADRCDFVVAHNAEFDSRFLAKYVKIDTPWLCTQHDFRFERENNKSLLHLANDLGVPIVNNHRALADCRLICNIFKRYSSEALEDMVKFAAQDSYTVIGLATYEQRELARNLGFRFDRATKKWTKRVKASELDSIVHDTKLPFKVVLQS